MADLNPLFYTSGPLVRLSKEFNLNGLSMVSVMPRIHSFLLPAGFTTPKSSGALVKERLDVHQANMIHFQAMRGHTDEYMKANFCSHKAALWRNVGENFGLRLYRDLCFNVVNPRLSIGMADGHFEPIEFRVHRKLGHRYVMLAETGEFIEAGVNLDGT